MAMYHDDDYIVCKNCSGKTFVEEKTAAFKREKTKTGMQLRRVPSVTQLRCTHCSTTVIIHEPIVDNG